MYKIYVSLTVVACMVGAGCSNKAPTVSVQENRAPLSEVVTETTTTNSESMTASQPISPLPPAKSKKIKRSHRVLSHKEKRTTIVFKNQIEDIKVSATDKTAARLAPKPKKEYRCPTTKHGHAEYLRSDIAYSLSGLDCQGDLPGRTFGLNK